MLDSFSLVGVGCSVVLWVPCQGEEKLWQKVGTVPFRGVPRSLPALLRKKLLSM